ncbi:MAG: hypothetical protein PHV85_00475 [Desulfovibrionaceae bacterium]|nr:hypothetical protein [Desulfovibrionaceae bacterium]
MPDPVIGTLKELSVELAKKQDVLVDSLTEDTPVLNVIPFEPATHELWNVYENVNTISGGGFVDIDSPLEDITADTKLNRVDLKIMSGRMFCPQDKAVAYGGKEKYFAKREPLAFRYLGQETEANVIYNNFRQYALDHGKKLNAGGTGDTNYCLLAVRFERGVTTGLYAPAARDKGKLFNIEALNGGNLYEHPDTKVPGYGVMIKGYFGIQLASPKCLAGIFNIDIANSKLPTAKQVDELLMMVRKSKDTYLFCHPEVMTVLADVGKGGGYRMGPDEMRVNREIEKWNNVPIVVSWNFKDGAEENESFA